MTPGDIPIPEPDQIRQDCARKLRTVQVSDHFQAILGCTLGEDLTTPQLVEMVITTDGHLLGRCDGESKTGTVSMPASGHVQVAEACKVLNSLSKRERRDG